MDELNYGTTALMLITPDAVQRGLSAEVVRRVGLAGFRVVGHRPWYTAPDNLDAFHRRNGPVDRDPRLYRLVEQLFALGPLLALAVQEGGDHQPDQVHQRLKVLKGLGDPAYAAPGSIRNDLRSMNTILNIVHSSDDAEDTAREASWFLEAGPGRLETDPAALARSLYSIESGRSADDRCFQEILGGVRGRLLTALRPRLSAAQRRAIGDHRGPDALHHLGGQAGSEWLTEVLPLDHGLQGLVDPPLPGDRSNTAPQIETGRLAEFRVSLDPWEHLVLATSRYYPPLACEPSTCVRAVAEPTRRAHRYNRGDLVRQEQ